MDEFISKCVRMSKIFAKINDTMQLRKILTADEYELFLDMYRVYTAFVLSEEKKEIKEK